MSRGSRIFSFAMALLTVALLIFFSSQGALGPFQGIVSAPLNLIQGIVGGTSRSVSNLFGDAAEFRRLRQRNEPAQGGIEGQDVAGELARLVVRGVHAEDDVAVARLSRRNAGQRVQSYNQTDAAREQSVHRGDPFLPFP